MKKGLVILALTIRALHADEPRNAVSIEGGGAGLLYSVDYERVLWTRVELRAGFATYSLGGPCGESRSNGGCWFVAGSPSAFDSPSATLLTFPVTVAWRWLHHGPHALEVGGGVTFAYAYDLHADRSGSAGGGYGTLFAGYRLSPTAHPGFQLRAGAMALVLAGYRLSDGDPVHYPITPWGYLSVGVAF